MRGFHDEMGGPESIAGPEWGRGVGMTAAGLPASPGVSLTARFTATRFVSPSEDRFVAAGVPSADTLRHNFLLRRQLNDPGYGASREVSWREKAANGLGVPYVYPAHVVPATRRARAKGIAYRYSPSE